MNASIYLRAIYDTVSRDLVYNGGSRNPLRDLFGFSRAEQLRVPKNRSLSNLYWCATHSVCRRQVWAVVTRVSHATCADPYPGVCLARTPWWSCPKNTHTPPHFTTYYSITLILTLLLSTYTTSTRWLTSVLSNLVRGDSAIGTIGWNFCTWKIKELLN